MENYNRLFLLQPDGESENEMNELRDQILSGKDVTKPEEYSGKVTLTQLNAYSGELKPQALSNFKTIKIEKSGEAYETNLAKLLLELQQGGAIEDVVEESIIEIDSDNADSELMKKVGDLTNTVAEYHNDYEVSVSSRTETVITEPIISTDTKWVGAHEMPNGERIEFVAVDDMFSYGSDIHILLNGVIVTDGRDGDILYSFEGEDEETGEDIRIGAYGFRFYDIPAEGDIVEFNFPSSFSVDQGQNAKSLKNTSDDEDTVAQLYEVFKAEMKAEGKRLDGLRKGKLVDLEDAQTTFNEKTVQLIKAREGYDTMIEMFENGELNSVQEVTDKTDELSTAISEELAAYMGYKAVESDLRIIDANIITRSSVANEQGEIRNDTSAIVAQFKKDASERIAFLEAVKEKCDFIIHHGGNS